MTTRTKTPKRRGRKRHIETPRQELFIQLCAELGNRTQAYVRAGYRSKYPAQEAYKLCKHPYISKRIQEAIDAAVGGKPGITSRLAAQADANLKDFEPWLEGKKSLRRLARDGVNVAVVKSASIRTSEEGETRRIELHSSQEAAWKLVRMGGYGDGGRDPDEPKPAQVSVTVDMGHLLSRRLADLPERPSAPGLPLPADRFAEQGAAALFGKGATAGTGVDETARQGKEKT